MKSWGAYGVWWSNSHRRGGAEPALTDSSKKIDAHGTSDRRPGSGLPKLVRTTDISVMQYWICSQDDAAHTPVLCGAAPSIVVYFNYEKFAAEYLL